MTQAAGPDQPWADADTNRSRNCTLAGASGVRRAAALLVALRLDLSSEIVPHLPHDDVGRLTWELSSIVELGPDEREEVLTRFYASAIGRDYITIGGIEFVERAL